MKAGRLFEPWLGQLTGRSPNPLVKSSKMNIRRLLELDTVVPQKYVWKYITTNAFNEELKRAETIEEANRLYWHDVAQNLEVYNALVVWRSAELLRATIDLLNSGEVLVPAILGRSAIELASAAVVNANSLSMAIHNTIDRAARDRDALKSPIVSDTLESHMSRIVHGTRIGDQIQEAKQVNVGYFIDIMSKSPGQGELKMVYESLIEVARPNVWGNVRTWADLTRRSKESVQLAEMKRDGRNHFTDSVRTLTIWALSWSSLRILEAVDTIQEVVDKVFEIWPPDGRKLRT
jgi:hypothetical protein